MSSTIEHTDIMMKIKATSIRVSLQAQELKTNLQTYIGSDSDSGQGSCEMDGPALLSKGLDSLSSGDEEVVVHKKSRSKSILQGSDSEEENVPLVRRATVSDEGSDNENKENLSMPRNKKMSRIRCTLLDSDGSDEDDSLRKREKNNQVPENLEATLPHSSKCDLDVHSPVVKSASKKKSKNKLNNYHKAKRGSVSSEDEMHVEFPRKKSKSKKHKAIDFALQCEGLPSDNVLSDDCQLDLPKEKNRKKSTKKVRDFEGNLGEEAKRQSKRSTEKESRQTAVSRNKKIENASKSGELEAVPPMEDSGCLLGDSDLYDKDLDEDLGCNSDTEEESLDAIRAAVKSKMNKQKVRDINSDHENYSHDFEKDEVEQKNKRTERKAARLSKEAIKQMHSETQRMIRESSLALPYHLPEPKSIHDFFKRRARPACQGSAMQLLKSSKYQPVICDERIDPSSNLTSGNPSEPIPFPVYPQMDSGCLDMVSATAVVSVHEVTSAQNILEQSSENCEKGEQHLSLGAALTDSENLSNTAVQEQNSDFTSVNNSQRFESEPTLQKVLAETVQIAPVTEGEDPCPKQEAKAESSDFMLKNPLLKSEVREKARKSKMERLREMGVDVSIKPRLCSDDCAFIDLDEPHPNKELEELKKRFLKHSLTKVKPKTERKMTLNVIRKERNAEGNEELRMDVVPVTIAAETLAENIHGKPGEKLQVLKAKLQAAMKLRRNDERKKRQALFKLDNEDGFEEEDEEEEMTDDSEEEGGTKENAEFLLGEAEEDTCDGEAVEDGDKETDRDSVDEWEPVRYADCGPAPRQMDSEGTLILFKDSSSKMGDCQSEDNQVRQEGKLDDDDSLLLPPLNKNSHSGSFELIGSMIPSYQPCNRNPARGGSVSSITGGFRSPSPGLFKASFISSASKSSGKTSEPSLPVEDSLDLYNASPEPKNCYLGTEESQFHFSLEDDTQSQLLDADGFLNVGHNRNKFHSSKQRLMLDSMDENAMDANMDQLLDLCTGQFGSSQVDSTLNTYSKGKQDMDELLDLCSGKFLTQAHSSTQILTLSSKASKEIDFEDPLAEAVALCSGAFPTDRREEMKDDEEGEEEFDDFKLLPDDNEEEEESGSEEDSDPGEGEGLNRSEDEDEEELLLKRQGKKRKLKMQDFLEDEAELSGSDAGSGDEFEGEDDEYEEEILDEALPSDEELMDQVNKIHRKVLMDDDKRQLRFYQERYLADGDLHSDGPGRLRRFRWKNLDDASQMDMFRGDSENDEEGHHEDLDETEAKYRKERFEREQWLRQQEKSGKSIEEAEEEIGEDSQFMKLAKKVTAKALQRKTSTTALESEHAMPSNPFEAFKCSVGPRTMKTGSLLNKPKEVLQKLTAMSDLNLNAPRNTRNFVFQALSPTKKDDDVKPNVKQVRKKISAVAAAPTPKRVKLEKPLANKNSRSIFPFLES